MKTKFIKSNSRKAISKARELILLMPTLGITAITRDL